MEPAQLAVPVITDTPVCAELHTPTRTHTPFFEDLVEFLKKEIPSLPTFFLCVWVEGSITHPHLLGTYMSSAVLSPRAYPQGLGRRDSQLQNQEDSG